MLPAAPLVDELRERAFDYANNQHILSLRSLVSDRQISRLLNGRAAWVGEYIADRLCVAIGLHPIFVWGDQWLGVARNEAA